MEISFFSVCQWTKVNSDIHNPRTNMEDNSQINITNMTVTVTTFTPGGYLMWNLHWIQTTAIYSIHGGSVNYMVNEL